MDRTVQIPQSRSLIEDETSHRLYMNTEPFDVPTHIKSLHLIGGINYIIGRNGVVAITASNGGLLMYSVWEIDGEVVSVPHHAVSRIIHSSKKPTVDGDASWALVQLGYGNVVSHLDKETNVLTYLKLENFVVKRVEIGEDRKRTETIINQDDLQRIFHHKPTNWDIFYE